MQDLLYLFLLSILTIISYQDFRERSISLLLFPLLAGSLIIYSWRFTDFSCHISYILWNLIFISSELLVLYTYFRIRSNGNCSLFKSWIGGGDVLFFISISILFSPVNFLCFIIIGMFFGLIGFFILRYMKRDIQTIPLAGVLSIELIIILIFIRFRYIENPFVDIFSAFFLV